MTEWERFPRYFFPLLSSVLFLSAEWEKNHLHTFPLIIEITISLSDCLGRATASAERAAIELGEVLAVDARERIFRRRCPSDGQISTYR